MIKKLLSCIGLVASAAVAAPPPSPAWTSDQIRAARPVDPVQALVMEYVLDDFTLCRSLAWQAAGSTFDNDSCYAGPAFRLAELANRRMLRAIIQQSGGKLAPAATGTDAPYWAEQQLSIQDAISDPLVASAGARGMEWRLGNEVVVRTSGDGLPFSEAERQAMARYLARHVDLHPQVRQALLQAGRLPGQIVIERRDLDRKSTEVLTFSNPQRRTVSYPLPPHLVPVLAGRSGTTAAEATGIRQTLLAIAGTAKPPKPGLDELIGRIREAVSAGRSIDAILQFMALSQQYGGELQSDPTQMDKLRALTPLLKPMMAAPEVAELTRASMLAGTTAPSPEREGAARYLADATKLDALPFGTFRYVTHLAAYPCASPAFKDLGEYLYSQFDMPRAWQAWDLGRAVDPLWRGGPMQAVAAYEERVRRTVPSNF